MIERVIKKRIEAMLALFLATPALLDEVFQPGGDTSRVTDAELAKIKELIVARTPKVIHSYPRDSATLPCYAVLLSAGPPAQYALAYQGPRKDGSPGQNYVGTVEDRTYDILVLGEGPDEVIYGHKLLKAILLSQVYELEELGAGNMRYSDAEINPMEANLPARVYGRSVKVTFAVEEYYPIYSTLTLIVGADVRRIEAGGGIEGVDEI